MHDSLIGEDILLRDVVDLDATMVRTLSNLNEEDEHDEELDSDNLSTDVNEERVTSKLVKTIQM